MYIVRHGFLVWFQTNINNAPNLEFDYDNPPLQSLTEYARKPEAELPFDILNIDYVDDA